MNENEARAFTENRAQQRARAERRQGLHPTNWRWYVTIQSIREYMAIMGCTGPLEDTNPDFLAAEEALGRYSLTAALTPKILPSGAVLYRSGKMKIRGRGGRRLEFVVVEGLRAEGMLPQLVSVRTK